MLETTFKTGLFRINLHCDDIQVFNDRFDDVSLFTGANINGEFLKIWITYKHENQINSVLAMYEQETNQNLSMSEDHMLDTMLKRHVDEKIRTRIFEDRIKEMK